MATLCVRLTVKKHYIIIASKKVVVLTTLFGFKVKLDIMVCHATLTCYLDTETEGLLVRSI